MPGVAAVRAAGRTRNGPAYFFDSTFFGFTMYVRVASRWVNRKMLVLASVWYNRKAGRQIPTDMARALPGVDRRNPIPGRFGRDICQRFDIIQ